MTVTTQGLTTQGSRIRKADYLLTARPLVPGCTALIPAPRATSDYRLPFPGRFDAAHWHSSDPEAYASRW